jgi:hypothetical protein
VKFPKKPDGKSKKNNHRLVDNLFKTTFEVTCMSKRIIQLFVSLTSFISVCGLAQTQTLSAANMGEIIKTYNDNQARFVTRYRGKPFSSQTIFAGATENLFMKGSFFGHFTVNGKQINCTFEHSNDVNRLIELNKGDKVSLEGVIDDIMFNDLQLKSCRFKK